MHDQHSPVGLAIESNARPGRGALLVQLVAQRLHDADEISEAEGTGLRHKKAVQLFHLSHNPSPYGNYIIVAISCMSNMSSKNDDSTNVLLNQMKSMSSMQDS